MHVEVLHYNFSFKIYLIHRDLLPILLPPTCGSCFWNSASFLLQGSFPCKQDGFLTLGHEFVGTIDELGSEVISFKIGQRVAVDPNSGCNKCDHCHNANYQFCPSGGINNTIGIYRNGGWATHVVVPENQVQIKDKNLFTRILYAFHRFFLKYSSRR